MKLPKTLKLIDFPNFVLSPTFPHSHHFSEPLEQKLVMRPDQIGDFIVNLHKKFIETWNPQQATLIWQARQEWIHFFSSNLVNF